MLNAESGGYMLHVNLQCANLGGVVNIINLTNKVWTSWRRLAVCTEGVYGGDTNGMGTSCEYAQWICIML